MITEPVSAKSFETSTSFESFLCTHSVHKLINNYFENTNKNYDKRKSGHLFDVKSNSFTKTFGAKSHTSKGLTKLIETRGVCVRACAGVRGMEVFKRRRTSKGVCILCSEKSLMNLLSVTGYDNFI